jgi:branched-chain amino acid aminotransferase
LHQGNNISTPAIEGTILPGITRNSIIEVAEGKGYKVTVHLFMGFNF